MRSTCDWPALVKGPAKVVANLPYNIATPLLIGWITGPQWFSSLTLMFQKEVAERIAAKPGGKDYGRLSVLCQHLCEVKKLFDVNRSAFTPPPKVTSSIVQLIPKAAPSPACDIAAPRTGHRRGLRPAPQDAAFKSQDAWL